MSGQRVGRHVQKLLEPDLHGPWHLRLEVLPPGGPVGQQSAFDCSAYARPSRAHRERLRRSGKQRRHPHRSDGGQGAHRCFKVDAVGLLQTRRQFVGHLVAERVDDEERHRLIGGLHPRVEYLRLVEFPPRVPLGTGRAGVKPSFRVRTHSA